MAKREKCNLNCRHYIPLREDHRNTSIIERSCKWIKEHGECAKLKHVPLNSPIHK